MADIEIPGTKQKVPVLLLVVGGVGAFVLALIARKQGSTSTGTVPDASALLASELSQRMSEGFMQIFDWLQSQQGAGQGNVPVQPPGVPPGDGSGIPLPPGTPPGEEPPPGGGAWPPMPYPVFPEPPGEEPPGGGTPPGEGPGDGSEIPGQPWPPMPPYPPPPPPEVPPGGGIIIPPGGPGDGSGSGIGSLWSLGKYGSNVNLKLPSNLEIGQAKMPSVSNQISMPKLPGYRTMTSLMSFGMETPATKGGTKPSTGLDGKAMKIGVDVL